MGFRLRSILLLLSYNLIIRTTDGALAAMSIDLGSQSLKIGLVKPGVPMEIVLNKDSRRKTPFSVGIKNGERFFGDAAVQLSLKHPANTFNSFLDLLGKQYDNPIVEHYKKRFPLANLIADEKRGTVVFRTSEGDFHVETLMAMILWNARDQCEAHAGQPVKEVVITVPVFFGLAERKALENAAAIVGINLLQLITDGSASGLNYGVFRRKSITEQEQTLLIYDIGFFKTTATLVGFRMAKEKDFKEEYPVISTLGIGFDRTLGGDELTIRLREYLLEKFVEIAKPKGDIRSNARSMAKLTKEAERLKQVLSANVDHTAQIESLFEDKDFRWKVSRDEFLSLFKDLESRFMQPVWDALKMADIKAEKVNQIVLMGAGTRVPRIQQLLQDVFNGKELGRFLNTDEAAAMGAVYQAAHLSKGFKVKKFDVQELQLFPVQVQFKSGSVSADRSEPSIINRILYGYKSIYPAPKKVISFTSHQNDFDFNLNYNSLSHFSEQQLKFIGSHNITKVDIKGVGPALAAELTDETATFKGVKVHFHMDHVGIVKVAQAELIVERAEPPSNFTLSKIVGKIGEFFSKSDPEKVEEESSSEDKPKEDADEFGELPKEGSSGEPKKEDASPEAGEAEKKPTEEESKKVESNDEQKKTVASTSDNSSDQASNITKAEEKTAQLKPKITKIPVTIASGGIFYDMNADEIKAASKILMDFEEKERLKILRDAAQNSLEALVYDLASKLDEEEFTRFASSEEMKTLRKTVSDFKGWLEDEVTFDTTKDEFDGKKKELDSHAKKIRFRKRQSEERDKYIDNLKKALNDTVIASFKSLSVFTEVELTTLEKLISETKEWLTSKTEEQKKLADNIDPVFTVSELKEKTSAVEREVNYLLNKAYAAKLKAEQEKAEKARQEAKEAAEKAKNASSNAAEGKRDDTVESTSPKSENEDPTVTKKAVDSSTTTSSSAPPINNVKPPVDEL